MTGRVYLLGAAILGWIGLGVILAQGVFDAQAESGDCGALACAPAVDAQVAEAGTATPTPPSIPPGRLTVLKVTEGPDGDLPPKFRVEVRVEGDSGVVPLVDMDVSEIQPGLTSMPPGRYTLREVEREGDGFAFHAWALADGDECAGTFPAAGADELTVSVLEDEVTTVCVYNRLDPADTPTPTPMPTPEPERFVYDLYFRWTIITWLGEEGADVGAALAGDTSDDDESDDRRYDISAIWRWDADTQSYRGYFPFAPEYANDFTTLERHRSYWIALEADRSGQPDIRWTIALPAAP